jgi:hypothetical protein
VNFISGSNFVFVVDRTIGAGPLNIVMEGISFDSLCSLEVSNDGCYINTMKVPFTGSKEYNSSIQVPGYNEARFHVNVRIFENVLCEYSPPKSLAFLLSPVRKKEFASAFEIVYSEHVEKVYQRIFLEEYVEGLIMMKGLGQGLTPSGDDFNSGFLIALHLRQAISKKNLAPVLDLIYQKVRGENLFTNAFLECSALGSVSIQFNNVIKSLLYSTREDDIYQSTRNLLSVGATSGADQALGFYTGIKRFLL